MDLAEKSHLRNMITYGRQGDGQAHLPRMYCSEVPVTLYSLMGKEFHKSVSVEQLLKIGFEEELKAGRDKDSIAHDAAEGIINHFLSRYKSEIKTLEFELGNPQYAKRSPSNLRREKNDLEQLLRDLEQGKLKLEDLFRARLGLAPKHETVDHSFKDRLKMALQNIYLKVSRVVRPVDLVREAETPGGQLEVVSYYSGDIPSLCDTEPDDGSALTGGVSAQAVR
ncbi:MAG: hypothetical protein AB7G93_23310 [Bdellovibrionales bacterium]